MGYSVSVSRGKIAPRHDSREYVPSSVEPSLMHRDVVYRALPPGGVAQAINEFYGPAIQRYNAKQKRADRKKPEDYYTALITGAEGYGKGETQEKPVYEYVLQIGNSEDNGVTDADFNGKHWEQLRKEGKDEEAAEYVARHLNDDPDREQLKEVLGRVIPKLEQRFPNFHIVYAYGHDDEPRGTFQWHVAVTPFTSGQKTGLDTRVSLRKALKAMGYTGNPREAIKQWQRDVKDMIEAEMNEAGYERQLMGNTAQHLDADTFRDMKEHERLTEEIEFLQEQIERKEAEWRLVEAQVDALRIEKTFLQEENATEVRIQKGLDRDLRAFQGKVRDYTPEAEKPLTEAERGVLDEAKQWVVKVGGVSKSVYEHCNDRHQKREEEEQAKREKERRKMEQAAEQEQLRRQQWQAEYQKRFSGKAKRKVMPREVSGAEATEREYGD